MKRMIAAAFAALALIGAGCSRGEDGDEEPAIRASTVVVPETRVDAVPHEEPAVARAQWRAVGRYSRTLRPLHDLLQSLRALASSGCLGSDFEGLIASLQRQNSND